MPRRPAWAAAEAHRQAPFLVESGPDRRWVDEGERLALQERVEALRALAAGAT